MRDQKDRKEIGGETTRIGDCYIWAEIHYLDSSTDYREHIPRQVSHRSTATGDEFITLDNARPLESSG